MTENMVRTQVYLTRTAYTELQRRAEKHGLTLAVQIREALESYLLRGKAVEDELEPLDLGNLFEITGKFGGSGLSDGSVNHDKYIYGDPHGEKALERERLRASSPKLRSLKVAALVHERPASYKTKKRPLTKRKKSRP